MKKGFKISLITIFILGLSIIPIYIFVYKKPDDSFERIHLPALKIEGNKTMYENGTHIVFRGVNMLGIPELLYYYSDHWNESYFQKMAEWNIKIVRMPIHGPAFFWYEENQPGYLLKQLDQAIQWAAKYGIYTIIDFHSCGWPVTGYHYGGGWDDTWKQNIYEFSVDQLKDFWVKMSKYFENDTRIAFFDLFNEPAKEDPNRGGVGEDLSASAWMEWKALAEELIDLIRANDPNRIVMVGGLQFAYCINSSVAFPVNRSNVLYSVHVYNESNWQISWDEAFGIPSLSVPVIVGEFGFDPNDPNVNTTIANFAEPLLNYLNSHSIGYLAWLFAPLVWGGFNMVLDWDFNPSIEGTFFYNDFTKV